MDNNIILEGTWIYDKSKECNLRIVKSHIIFGTGDYEDTPEIRDDLEVECYYVEYESLIEQGKFCTRSQAYLTLNEAIDGEEKILNQKIKFVNKLSLI